MKLLKKLTIYLLVALLSLIPLTTETYARTLENWEVAFNNLKLPKVEMLDSGIINIRIGDKLIFPYISTSIIPTDLRELLPNIEGELRSSDENIVKTNEKGFIEAINNGKCEVSYTINGDVKTLKVEVSDENMPIGARNLVYNAKKEFYLNKMQRLPKFNEYAKWYYKKKKEVGWCSVFGSYIVNASGLDSYKYNTIPVDSINKYSVFGLLEGQVGHQWDGYSSVDRFVNVPKPGYYVIYGNRKNAYKYTHIGIVVDVIDLGNNKYRVTTVEGNMSNTVKSYTYVYDSTIPHPKENMFETDKNDREDSLPQYELHTEYWCVFGFCATWI